MTTYTSIRIRKEIKDEMDKVKIHHRETYEDVIIRLIEIYKKVESNDNSKND